MGRNYLQDFERMLKIIEEDKSFDKVRAQIKRVISAQSKMRPATFEEALVQVKSFGY